MRRPSLLPRSWLLSVRRQRWCDDVAWLERRANTATGLLGSNPSGKFGTPLRHMYFRSTALNTITTLLFIVSPLT
eukprot:2670108-Pyramimonas_sp.AAC.1